jgi:itaconate CoA-transferase
MSFTTADPDPETAVPADQPLTGVTVVSIEQAVAAPFATRQLADLGARVIKIERPGAGDFARSYDSTVKGLASYFVWLNRAKESITLDLKHPAAGEILHRLVGQADVFVQNLAPGATARMGLSAAKLRAERPELIVCDISGYGSDGPYAQRRAYDLLIQCETGLLSVTGTPEQPAKVGASVADISAGMYAYSSVLAALFARARSGVGASLEVSLFESLTEWMAQPMYYAMYTGAPPPRTGTSHATIGPYGTFRTGGGGAVQLAVQNNREWGRLCESVLGRPDLAQHPAYATNADRVANGTALAVEIEVALSGRTADEVVELLDAAQIANGRFNTVLDLLDHPQLANRWTEVESPAGPLRALPPPVRMGGKASALGAVPSVGEHTASILEGLGYSAEDIAGLHTAGAI